MINPKITNRVETARMCLDEINKGIEKALQLVDGIGLQKIYHIEINGWKFKFNKDGSVRYIVNVKSGA